MSVFQSKNNKIHGIRNILRFFFLKCDNQINDEKKVTSAD